MDKQSTLEILRCLAIGIALSVGVVFFHRKIISRADTVLRNWAGRNGYELMCAKRCFLTGAFNPFTTSRNQIVYFVKVRDQECQERSGWVRCGSFASLIFFSDETEVKWKEIQ
jgi:hypothetical protein